MKIIHLTPGSGDTFYCENCMRDKTAVRALRRLGHDAMMVPLYLPTGEQAHEGPLFFGGINVYLQQKLSFFRRTPRWLDKLFDSQPLLKLAGKLAGMTRANDLADTMISMLRGPRGNQAKELNRLVDWLATQNRPDLIVLSDPMLMGLAAEMKRRLNVPLACLLQDEEEFIEAIDDPHRLEAWDLIGQGSEFVDAFIAVSRFYANRMQQRLGIPTSKMHVVPIGIEVDTYEPAHPEGPTIGFLSRISRDKGADLLVEAFIRLRRRPELQNLRLRLSGGKTTSDDEMIHHLQTHLTQQGLIGQVEFLPNLTPDDRRTFLESLTVLSVPERHGEAFGMYVVEALACGVPVVQPANGGFPELLEATGGGVLIPPRDLDALENALADLLLNPQKAQRLGQAGMAAVRQKFSSEVMARNLERTFLAVTGQTAGLVRT